LWRQSGTTRQAATAGTKKPKKSRGKKSSAASPQKDLISPPQTELFT
jgi:hypothetical protein